MKTVILDRNGTDIRIQLGKPKATFMSEMDEGVINLLVHEGFVILLKPKRDRPVSNVQNISTKNSQE